MPYNTGFRENLAQYNLCKVECWKFLCECVCVQVCKCIYGALIPCMD